MNANFFQKYRIFLLVLAANLLLALWSPPLAALSLRNSARFLGEILLILPPIMVLMGLLDAWVPRQVVEAHMGRDAGVRGAASAMLLGTAAAGPLYAAFPLAVSLRNKGARLSNIVIFLGSWASIKIPMIFMESSFIGLRFSLLRLLFTIPCVVAAGYLMEWIMPAEASPDMAEQV